MESLYIGCSGFSYSHWKNIFYPNELSKNKWLEYYAEHFNTLELNVTFYRLPSENTFLKWYNNTPKNFIFSVKGSRFITHIKKLSNCEKATENFFNNVLLLKDKLGAILWQFPPTFEYDINTLEVFIKNINKYNVKNCFEFRNSSWICNETIELCKFYNISLCLADWPDFLKNTPLTANYIYMRRHGKSGSYASCYTKNELMEDANFIKAHYINKEAIFIYFNNDFNAYAPKNALQLKNLIETNNQ